MSAAAIEHADHNRPEAQCLRDGIHEPHDWQSLTHSWWCPGREISRHQLLAEHRIEHFASAARRDPDFEVFRERG